MQPPKVAFLLFLVVVIDLVVNLDIRSKNTKGYN